MGLRCPDSIFIAVFREKSCRHQQQTNVGRLNQMLSDRQRGRGGSQTWVGKDCQSLRSGVDPHLLDEDKESISIRQNTLHPKFKATCTTIYFPRELGRPQDVSNKEDQSVPIIVDNLFWVINQIWRSGESSKLEFRIIFFFLACEYGKTLQTPSFWPACLSIAEMPAASIAPFQHQQSHIDVSMASFSLFPCIGSTPSKERDQGGDFMQCTVNK